MINFTAYNPTKLVFGKDSINALEKHLNEVGKKALIIFGNNSAKLNGAYNHLIQKLNARKIEFVEFWGIKPNPRIDEVRKAIHLGIEQKVDMVIAVGGGSVIDSAKMVALCIPANLDPWAVMKGQQKPKNALPIITILTLAATGSEMNPFAVLQNDETHEKIGYGSSLIYPTLSICDPTYTLTVNRDYTAYGIVDIVAHSLEAYFGEGNAYLSDRFVIAILKEVTEIAIPLLNNLSDYTLRERIMWASTCALNGITLHGRKSGDWGVHDIAHYLSALFDVPHGASLSIVYPAWMKTFKRKINNRLVWLGKEWFGVKTGTATIERMEEFFQTIKSAIRLSDLGLNEEKNNLYKKYLIQYKPSGYNYLVDEKAQIKIFNTMQ